MTAPWAATHRHRKGGLYRLLVRGVWEPDRSAAVVYDDAEGTVWVRPAAEFDDGRFTPLTPPATEGAAPPARGGLRGRIGALWQRLRGRRGAATPRTPAAPTKRRARAADEDGA